MRQVVLDTETTGLDVEQGHRIIEIGCVELLHRRVTQRTFHHYVQPDRDIDAGASAVHGITARDLAGKPRFRDIALEFIEFIGGAEVIIHNADFDIGFIRRELSLSGHDPDTVQGSCTVTDTLALARRLHPGQKNSLDALCRRYAIDNSGREYHGALLDARLLADVYLAMTGGQAALSLESAPVASETGQPGMARLARAGLSLRVIQPGADEIAEHERYLDMIEKESNGKAIWRSTRSGS